MITFGTLLWIDESNHSSINNKNKSIVSYFRQVDLLARSLQTVFGCELVVFTNKQQTIQSWFASNHKTSPRFVQIHSSIDVPNGIKFYSAHFKIDALIAGIDFLQSNEDRFFLLDTDIIAIKAFNVEQLLSIGSADLVYYDISEQVFPTYGFDVIKKDIELIAGNTFDNPKWFGGEFIGGSKIGLTSLVEFSRKLLPIYFDSMNNLHHIGDEMYISSALNQIIKAGHFNTIDQRKYHLISRHWARFVSPTLKQHMSHNFIHCPGSKPALEVLSRSKKISFSKIYFILSVYQFLVLFYQKFKKCWHCFIKRN